MFFDIFKTKTARTQRELNALISTAYADGFKAGYKIGQLDTIFSEITPNDIRKACGLDHREDFSILKEDEEND